MDTFTNCLSQQMGEFELLNSMYPNPGAIVVTDKNIIVDINNFLNNKSDNVPNYFDYTLNLDVSESKLEVSITLPTCYPNEEPDIYVRSNQLNRQQQTKLNSDLSSFIKLNHVGEVCLYTVITWLQDNIDKYKLLSETEDNCKLSLEIESQTNANQFSRLWIYSHHIYNKKKREEIVKIAKDLKLTGFCLPGKPGVICVEGDYDTCLDWWKDIKSMNWKKIMIRHTEMFETLETNKRFLGFEELHFINNTSSKHANMSDFSKYMHDHGFGEVFNDLFGFCNVTSGRCDIK